MHNKHKWLWLCLSNNLPCRCFKAGMHTPLYICTKCTVPNRKVTARAQKASTSAAALADKAQCSRQLKQFDATDGCHKEQCTCKDASSSCSGYIQAQSMLLSALQPFHRSLKSVNTPLALDSQIMQCVTQPHLSALQLQYLLQETPTIAKTVHVTCTSVLLTCNTCQYPAAVLLLLSTPTTHAGVHSSESLKVTTAVAAHHCNTQQV
jgi:hypothetical protein